MDATSTTPEKKKATLLLADGTVFHGYAAGIAGKATGEICFNTGMTGYQEIFTDPSYYGQIMVMATSHIGNYGTYEEESESDGVKISGLVCNKFSSIYSRPLADHSIQKYFEENNIVAITDVDTRAIVRHIRDSGAMNCIISTDGTDLDQLKMELEKVPSMEGLELSSKVTTSKSYTLGDESAEHKVAVLDLGAKKNILRCLAARGCYLKVFPMSAGLDEMLEWQPDGFMISNGPGDPGAMTNTVDKIKKIIDTDIPVFGICMGHQLIGLASGLTSFKMHHGHRGINHPVKNLISGKGEITSQNHGFGISDEGLEDHPEVEITHRHLNDNTVAGLQLKNKKVFCVQYHPEAGPGPHDSRYLFDQFINNMVENKTAVPQ